MEVENVVSKSGKDKKDKVDKRKTWKAKYLSQLTLEALKNFIKEQRIEFRIFDRPPLYTHLQGLLVDEEQKEIYMYFYITKDKKWLQEYSFLTDIGVWECEFRGWESVKRHSVITNLDIKKLEKEVDQKEKKSRRWAGIEDDEEDEEENIFPVFEEEKEAELTEQLAQNKTKLQKKTENKKLKKQNICFQSIDLQDKHLQDSYREIGDGENFFNLIQKSIVENDFSKKNALLTFSQELRDWQEEVSTVQNLSLKNIEINSHSLGNLYSAIKGGQSFSDLVKISCHNKNPSMQLILNRNKKNLKTWEKMISNPLAYIELLQNPTIKRDFHSSYLKYFFREIELGKTLQSFTETCLNKGDGRAIQTLVERYKDLSNWRKLVQERSSDLEEFEPFQAKLLKLDQNN